MAFWAPNHWTFNLYNAARPVCAFSLVHWMFSALGLDKNLYGLRLIFSDFYRHIQHKHIISANRIQLNWRGWKWFTKQYWIYSIFKYSHSKYISPEKNTCMYNKWSLALLPWHELKSTTTKTSTIKNRRWRKELRTNSKNI